MTPFLAEAVDAVGAAHVLEDPGVTASYRWDWTRRFGGSAGAVLRPGSVAEVAALVDLARVHGVALVPQGGNTGLVGGSVPQTPDQVVLSLRRLDAVADVDVAAGQVTAGAGVTLASLQAAARAAGMDFGVDLAARDSATVGGMIATNAGGVHVMRHGPMRQQVLGVEAVLGTGAVIRRLSGLVKDNTGYDLGQLLCGSEGTLGIVTASRLRLVPRPAHVVVGLVALDSLADAVGLAAGLRSSVEGLQALELMDGEGFRRTAEHLQAEIPVDPTAATYLLVEAAAQHDPTVSLAEALADVADRRVAAATAAGDRERLWRFREAHTETAAALAADRGTVVHKLDVTLPIGALADFCAEVVRQVAAGWPGATTMLYGHVGDGNIHVNVIGPPGDDEGVDDLILGLVVASDGSISAEHGIGVAKKRWLPQNRSPAELATMHALKSALDPAHVLNPSALFPN